MLQQPVLSPKQAYGEQFDVKGLNFFRRLLQALQNNEFVVYFQPKVSITDMRIAGAEALVRWNYDGQVLPPVKFIPFCERTGLVIDIDFYVLEETCKKMREWMDAGMELVRISVNFSKYHFNEEGVAERIYSVISHYGVPPEYIEVEFTETAYLDKEELLESTVDKLRSYGIKSSIDDFGSGYSSLNLLQNMDFEVVKLDKSLLGKGVENDKAKKVISSIIHMAKELNMEVLAEGVETVEELKLLRSLRCDIVQGFFFDKPLPVEAFETRLRAGGYKEDGSVKEPERKRMELKDVEGIGADENKDGSLNRYLNYEELYDRKRNNGMFIAGLVMLLLAITVLAVAFAVVKSGKHKGQEEEISTVIEKTFSQSELDEIVTEKVAVAEEETRALVEREYRAQIREVAGVYSGMTNYLRTLYPDDLVFTDGSRYNFVPINRDLKMSDVLEELFVKDDTTGYLYYTDASGNKTSYIGIDVSSHQGTVDWNKVKAAGIDFAVIRCGIRGYGTGNIVEDTEFKNNIFGAANADVPTAVYFYTQAINTTEAVEEAQFVLSLLSPFSVKGPVVLDVESASSDERIKDLTSSERTDIILAFCDTIKLAGYTPMIYADSRFYTMRMEIERLEEFDKWYANYNSITRDPEASIWSFNSPLVFPYKYRMWQYTNTGRVNGVNGNVDLNVLFDKWW
ncbi:MAG: EAL domain-containing protein [Lachnospiraceae bacterium]|nr:EAL domain-containing protein [Lachnospiraceae bacterium]